MDGDRRRVSRAAKDLLANTIHSVTHQNRVLEERSCWRALGRRTRKQLLHPSTRSRNCLSPPPPSRPSDRAVERRASRRPILSVSDDRWDHSGFQQLYPNDCVPGSSSQKPVSSSESTSDSRSSRSVTPSSCTSSSGDGAASGHRSSDRKRKKRKERKGKGKEKVRKRHK